MFTTQFQRSRRINDQKKKYEQAFYQVLNTTQKSALIQIETKPLIKSLKDRMKAKEAVVKSQPLRHSFLSHEIAMCDIDAQKYLN